MDYGIIFILLAFAVGLWMTWGVGANDLANIMSTALGSHAITVRQALFIAIIFEIAGAILGGAGVTDTIRHGIVNSDLLQSNLLVYAMLSVLLAGATWMTAASYMGMPVSITNAIVGALVGVSAIMLGVHAVHWQTVGYIAISWIVSPTLSGVTAFLLFISIRYFILGASRPFRNAIFTVPIYLFLVGIVLAIMTTLKAARHYHLVNHPWSAIGVVIITALIVWLIGIILMRRLLLRSRIGRHSQFVYIEGMFSILMFFTACAMVFAHGSNDVAIAVGPVVSVMGLILEPGTFDHGMMLQEVTLFGCLGVILGLFMYGRKVIATVGHEITTLTPSRAFAATLAAATIVIVSTSTGIPVSATQSLVGAVFGVGLARGIDALNLAVIRNIFMSWIITVPVAAGLATLFFYGLKGIFG